MIKFLKNIYQILGLAILKTSILIKVNRIRRKNFKFDFAIKTFSVFNKHVFFGYYDLNPISQDNQKVLSIVVPKSKITNISAEVGYFDLNKNKKFHPIGTTKTWCWQQGARLRWSTKDADTIIYNNIDNNQYGCVFQNIINKNVLKQVSYPIYDLSKDEKKGLSLNFSRLQRLRPGYGYDAFPDASINNRASDKDGIFLIDIEKNTSKLIISLKNISEIQPHHSMNGADHYINHLSWNKSSTRFLFFHLWTNKKTRSSRLFTADKNGQNIYLLENEEIVSHYDWKDDDFICMTTHSKNFGLRYSIYKDLSSDRKILNSKLLTKDGHPTFHPVYNHILLTDTYPNKYGERTLFSFNTEKNEPHSLGNYKSPLKYRKDYRCDLHPRWSNDGKLISFDSTHTNQRTLNIIGFENTLYS